MVMVIGIVIPTSVLIVQDKVTKPYKEQEQGTVDETWYSLGHNWHANTVEVVTYSMLTFGEKRWAARSQGSA